MKIFDLTPGVMGYVETLFGHQDQISCVEALRSETAVSAGTRDRTVRFWKVVDESQLVFRGGGKSRLRDVLEGAGVEGLDDEEMEEDEPKKTKGKSMKFLEGTVDAVTMIDEHTFVSGGDTG